ncbi:M28 family peptidase [Rhodopirellula sp.]|nr:M28 family peptidase [Rhodopirellula sp.]
MRNVMIPYQITVMVLATFSPLTLVWGQEGSADKPQVVAEASGASQDAVTAEESNTGADEEKNESLLLSKTRQLTFEGRRAGEGYFSADGSRMVFQSERDAANPFYQIYVTDLETGDIEKVSPGYGKTTCAWIHPSGERVLFASTQDDTEARSKQKQELELRESGKQRRYAWDYDNQYELYAKELADGKFRRLTNAKGYDAEGSYSPDGSLIAFASNRNAFDRKLSEREKELFEIDPASMIDIFVMNADGSNVRQLTDVAGYDGGPFFSPDGKRICWRRFAENGATAEIYSMDISGGDVKRLTNIGAMSWAPYYHPSGDYLIFTTNKHGFGNFELYLVRVDGKGEPVRVTDTDGFDGLPVFLPDGKRLSWTSTRTAAKQSQIFMAEWDDAAARSLLNLDSNTADQDKSAALAAAESSEPGFLPTDSMRHVDFLARPDLGGRLTGTAGERRATAYVAAYLESLGFQPAGENGTFFHAFDFPAGSTLTDANQMMVSGKKLELSKDWQPLAFSKDGETAETGIVFAGYGMQIPASDGTPEYDSYVHLAVGGQWVMVLRDMPQDITAEQRQKMARYSSPRRKASIARDLGAKGIIFVTGPTSKVKNQLIRFDQAASQASVSIAAVSVTNSVAEQVFHAADQDLAKSQKQLDDGSLHLGFPLQNAKASATVGIERKRGTGRNVIARMTADAEINNKSPVLIVGAHIDHLGTGGGGGSLAKDDERGQVHVGADDNASGVAAMLEIAQYLAAEKKAGRLKSKRDLLVAAWSGEELGLFGSQAFADDFYRLYPDAPQPAKTEEKSGDAAAHAHGTTTDATPLTAAIAAYMNLDMVGRLREKLVIQGIGSSPGFASEVQRRNLPVGLELTLDKTSTRLPTDASAFVARGVPILSAFTGAHEDYHTPRDTPDKLNYEGVADIARLFALIGRGFLTSSTAPEFKLEEGEAQKDAPRARLTAYLGTIPDYVAGDVKGLKLSGVAADGPAAKAGVRGGDIIVRLAGRKIEDIYDYTYAIEALKIGEQVQIVVQRGAKTVTMKVTPTSRD